MEKSGAATKTENEISQSLPIPEHKVQLLIAYVSFSVLQADTNVCS